jgi:hypothetical protein
MSDDQNSARAAKGPLRPASFWGRDQLIAEFLVYHGKSVT